MKLTSSCGKCDAQDHYIKEVTAGGGLSANYLPLGFSAWLNNSRYRLRVCGSCGLTQWFVVEEFLDLVKQKFKREPT